MQPNNTNNIILDEYSNVQEYRINNVLYNVNRIFNDKKTIKEIIIEKISCEKVSFSN